MFFNTFLLSWILAVYPHKRLLSLFALFSIFFWFSGKILQQFLSECAFQKTFSILDLNKKSQTPSQWSDESAHNLNETSTKENRQSSFFMNCKYWRKIPRSPICFLFEPAFSFHFSVLFNEAFCVTASVRIRHLPKQITWTSFVWCKRRGTDKAFSCACSTAANGNGRLELKSLLAVLR